MASPPSSAAVLRRSSGILLCGLLAGSCSSSTEPDLQPSVAVVHGQVVSEAGEAVPETHVRVSTYPMEADGCADGDGWLAGMGESDSAGEYSIVGKYAHVGRIDMCVAVEAQPPEDSGFDTGRVEGAEVEFIHESLTPPRDSVRVDVVLSGE